MQVYLSPGQYGICFQALAVGERTTQMIEWDEILGMLTQFKSVGKQIPDTPLYFTDTDCIIELNPVQCKILNEFIDSTSWRPLSLEHVKAVKALLQGAYAIPTP